MASDIMDEMVFEDFDKALAERQEAWVAEGDGDKLPVEFYAIELVGELGELFNVIKKLMREQYGVRGSRATQRDKEDEFGDALICLKNMASKYGVDLEHVARRKFNETSEKYGFPHRVALAVAVPPPSGDREAMIAEIDALENGSRGLGSRAYYWHDKPHIEMSRACEIARSALAAPSAGDCWQVPQINVHFMLACYVSPEPGGVIWPGGWQSSAGKDTRDWLLQNGLIASDYSPTERGKKWVEALLSTPLPAPPAKGGA